MTRLLVILASPASGDEAWSTRAAHVLAARLAAADPDAETVVRDLGDQPPPHLGRSLAMALQARAAERTAEHEAAMAPGRTYSAEVEAADIVIIATPMVNLGPPSQLKAWFDHMLTPTSPTWTDPSRPPIDLSRQQVFLIETRVPISGELGSHFQDLLHPYLHAVLTQMGAVHIETIAIDCLTQDPEQALLAFDESLRDIGRRFP